MALVVLLVALSGLVVLVWRDRDDYASFKRLTATEDRQRRYRAWLVKSFLIFGAGAVVGLAAVGRLGDLASPPAAFTALVPAIEWPQLGRFGRAMAVGGAIGLVIGVLARRRARRAGSDARRVGPVVIGDVAPILPRNAAERGWVVLLALNAGLSEELFFRVLLPALFYMVLGDAAVSLGLSAVAFGLTHLYQGWKGVVATLVIGALLTLLYLGSRSIAVAIAAHAVLDLNGLVLLPLLFGRRGS